MEKGNLQECFIICPIGNEGSKTRERSDKILRHVLTPPLQEFGYFPIRADKIEKSGVITAQVINSILSAPLVIADLTEHNPNVFYELAIRHMIRRPYIQMIEKNENIPFDIRGIRTIEIDHMDLDSVESAKEQIKKQILSFEREIDVDSPISIAIDSKNFKLDSKITENLLVEMKELRSQLEEMQQRIVRDLEPLLYRVLSDTSF